MLVVKSIQRWTIFLEAEKKEVNSSQSDDLSLARPFKAGEEIDESAPSRGDG